MRALVYVVRPTALRSVRLDPKRSNSRPTPLHCVQLDPDGGITHRLVLSPYPQGDSCCFAFIYLEGEPPRPPWRRGRHRGSFRCGRYARLTASLTCFTRSAPSAHLSHPRRQIPIGGRASFGKAAIAYLESCFKGE